MSGFETRSDRERQTLSKDSLGHRRRAKLARSLIVRPTRTKLRHFASLFQELIRLERIKIDLEQQLDKHKEYHQKIVEDFQEQGDRREEKYSVKYRSTIESTSILFSNFVVLLFSVALRNDSQTAKWISTEGTRVCAQNRRDHTGEKWNSPRILVRSRSVRNLSTRKQISPRRSSFQRSDVDRTTCLFVDLDQSQRRSHARPQVSFDVVESRHTNHLRSTSSVEHESIRVARKLRPGSVGTWSTDPRTATRTETTDRNHRFDFSFANFHQSTISFDFLQSNRDADVLKLNQNIVQVQNDNGHLRNRIEALQSELDKLHNQIEEKQNVKIEARPSFDGFSFSFSFVGRSSSNKCKKTSMNDRIFTSTSTTSWTKRTKTDWTKSTSSNRVSLKKINEFVAPRKIFRRIRVSRLNRNPNYNERFKNFNRISWNLEPWRKNR